MGVTDACYDFARGVGTFIGGSVKTVTSIGRAVSESVSRLRPLPSIEKIRNVVITELQRLRGKEVGLSESKLEERLQIMAETILALQNRINELGARGPVSEAAVLEAMSSVKVTESLNDNERLLLVNVFRRNMSLQKPELVDAALEGVGG